MTADSANREETSGPLVRELSPHQIAGLIRGLDSRLIGIEYDHRGDVPVLIYSFEVAGKRQAFLVIVDRTTLISIADIYPEAASYERVIHEQFDLMFRRADEAES